MSITEADFKLIDCIEPPVYGGEHTVSATQSIIINGTIVANYSAKQDFKIALNAFTLDSNEIFSVYPANGAAGDYTNTLPFITFTNRTLPWSFGKTPFIALIVLANSEIIGENDIAVKDLRTVQKNVYCPLVSAFPSVYAESDDTICRTIDIARETYNNIFPPAGDISLLAHAKLVDLSRCSDTVCARDGYFSEVIANRFVPSADEGECSSVCHLVTTFGCGEKISDDYSSVRLVSLYHWNLLSHKDSGMPFTQLIGGLSKNTGAIGCENANKATAVKEHFTRTGETTYSLYHSPLVPYAAETIEQLSKSRTGDGRLLYNSTVGVFDVSYAAAFQLGRLITLSQPAIAAKALAHRNDKKTKAHMNALRENATTVNFGEVGKGLLDYEKAISERKS
jgi:predicted heme/steroid binding protein